MANKKYKLRGSLIMATDRGHRDVKRLERILSLLYRVDAEAMVYRLKEGKSLKEPMTYDEFCETIEKMKERAERLKAWQFAQGMSDIDGAEPSPEMKEMIQQEIDGEITTEDIKHRLDEIYSEK